MIMIQNFKAQQGASLIVVLVMLLLLTLSGASALTSSTTNLKVVRNMQLRMEAIQSAQQAIENVISTTQFVSTPSNAVTNPCGTLNTYCVDANGDSTSDYTVVLTPNPTCVAGKILKNAELNLVVADDFACATAQTQQFGITGNVTGDSLCANAVWDITARATSNTTGATATVTQGVAVRVGADDTASYCL